MRIAAKLRGGGPILQSGLKTMGYGRVTATSDRHRQPLAQGCQSGVLLFLSFRAVAHDAGLIGSVAAPQTSWRRWVGFFLPSTAAARVTNLHPQPKPRTAGLFSSDSQGRGVARGLT